MGKISEDWRLSTTLQEAAAQCPEVMLKASKPLTAEIKEQISVAEELRKSEDIYRLIVQTAGEGIWSQDAAGNTSFVNKRMADMLGRTASEMVGKPVVAFVVEDERGDHEVRMEKRRQGVNEVYERRFRHAAGHDVFCRVSTSALMDAAGNYQGAFAMLTDITEQKRWEEIILSQRDLGVALAGTTSLHDALRLCLTMAIRTAGLDSGGIYLLDDEEGIFNLVVYEGITTAFADKVGLFAPDSPHANLVKRKKPAYLSIRDKDIFIYEGIIGEGIQAAAIAPIHYRGRIIGNLNVASHTLPEIPPFSRRVIEIVAAQIGVYIGRALAENALRISEKRFRDLAALLPLPVFETDSQGRLTFANRMMAEVFGYTEADTAQGLDRIGVVIPEEERAKYEEMFTHLRHGETIDAVEFTMKRKDGATFPALLSAKPIRHRNKFVGLRGVVVDITERKDIEKRLKKNEELYRAIFENTGQASFIFGKDTKIKIVNAEFEKLSGYSREEMEGKMSWMEIVEQRDLERLLSYHRVRGKDSHQAPRNYEFRFLTKEGTCKDVYVTIDVIPGTKERVASLLDITKRKAIERAVRDSEEKYRNLMEEAPIGFCIVALDGTIQYVNRRIEETTGWQRKDLIGQNSFYVGFFDEETRGLLMERLATRLAGGAPKAMEIPVTRRDGKRLWVEIKTTILRRGGEPAFAQLAITDITERKQAVEALKESEEKYRTVLENIQDAFFRTDVHGRLIMTNPGFLKALGYATEGEVQGQTLADFFPEREECENFLADLQQNGFVKHRELKLRHRNGDIRIISVNAQYHWNKAGVCAGIEGIFRDITDMKKMDLEKKKLEDQLNQVQKMQAIGTLAGGIAHDFNNILGALMGYADLAKFKTKDDGIKPYLERITNACDRAKDLVSQILTFSRQHETERKPLLLTPLIRETMKLLRSSLPSTIEIRLQCLNRNDTVLADPIQIHQVLMNLCTNAAHAMGKKGGVLEIKVTEEDLRGTDIISHAGLKEGPHLRLEVRDTGHGIDATIMDKIFDPFFTTKEPGEGTGLGLSVVYGIIKNLNGSISVASEPNRGTVFIIYLPLIDADVGAEVVGDAVIPRGKGHILLVDDEEPIASLGKEILTALGYDITVRYSSLDALEAFRANPRRFDLIVSDVTMPNMTGVALAREILSIRPEIPILLTSGFSDLVNEEQARKMGVKAFIMKPLSLQVLAQAVSKLLTGGVSKN